MAAARGDGCLRPHFSAGCGSAEADAALFDSLEENDILFIDSSHAGKIDSDVYTMYLEILPRLKPGVLIHIHDITFPYLTVPPEHVLFDYYIYWNESAFVKAF
jgi:hypothetical protein